MTWEVDPALLPTLPGALCAGHSHPEIWFDSIHKREAVAICRTCPAIEPCRAFCDELEAGKPFGEWAGVWAAEDPKQRRRRRQGSKRRGRPRMAIGSSASGSCGLFRTRP
jgi:hypothetical protein